MLAGALVRFFIPPPSPLTYLLPGWHIRTCCHVSHRQHQGKHVEQHARQCKPFHLDADASFRDNARRCLHGRRQCVHPHILHGGRPCAVERRMVCRARRRSCPRRALWHFGSSQGTHGWERSGKPVGSNLYVFPRLASVSTHRGQRWRVRPRQQQPMP